MPFTAGLPETGCGAGSTVAYTESIRAWLPALLRDLGVKTLLDAPCGDFNWMARTDLSGIDYVGCDYDPEHVQVAVARDSEPVKYRPRSKTVMVLDVVNDRLPYYADLMLCRDFLQHLPNGMVTKALSNFVSSGIPWLLATSHTNTSNVDILKPGMFRPLNLCAHPFWLPPPQRWAEDGDGRILGLWPAREHRA